MGQFGQIANYPAGFASGVAIRGTPILQSHSGNTFWVSNSTALLRGQSAGSDQNKGDFNHPFATLNYAITQCQANAGDVIYIKPGHIESLAAAGSITQSVAGVSVIGLGQYNLRPKFILGTAATATYLVSAANSYITNLWMQANLSNVVTCFDVTGVGCTIDNIRFTNAGVNLDFLTCVTASGAANTADGLTVSNCNWTTIDTDDFSLVAVAAACNDLTIWNNHMVSTSAQASASSISNANLLGTVAGTVMLNANIGWNRVQNAMTAGELLVSNDGSTSTGICHNNYVKHLDTTTTHDLGADGTGLSLFENKSVSTNALSGFLLPAADVNL